MPVPTLYQFFRHQVRHGFLAHGLAEPTVVDYISDILSRFAETRALYALQDSGGQPLEYIVDMLEEWLRAQGSEGGAASPSRERFVMRHLGEYTLFMSGLFRERLKKRGELNYYLAHGRSAYWRCADHEAHPPRRQLYWRLHHDFGRISNTLDHMRHEQFPLTAPPSGNLLMAFWRV